MTDAEIAARREALEQAAGSLRTEGLEFSRKNSDLREAWVAGEISGDELLTRTFERLRVSGDEKI